MFRKVILLIPFCFLLTLGDTSSYAEKKPKRRLANTPANAKEAAVKNDRYDDPNAPLVIRRTIKPPNDKNTTEIDLN